MLRIGSLDLKPRPGVQHQVGSPLPLLTAVVRRPDRLYRVVSQIERGALAFFSGEQRAPKKGDVPYQVMAGVLLGSASSREPV